MSEIYAEYKEEKENRYNRLDYIWRKLGPYFGHLRPDQITKNVCKDYISKRKVKNGTVIRELGALRSALYWFDKNTPAQFYFPQTPPPKDRYLTRKEALDLINGANEPHIKLFIILSIGTAARKSALLELKWCNVDFERGLINLGTGEGNKKRAIVPMNNTTERALEEAYKARLTDHVIEYNGRPIKDVKNGIKRAAERAKLEGVSPHVLRHTSAVWMAENGVPMSEIAQYLGHTNTRITEKVYARYSPEYLKKAAGALELSSIEHGVTP